MTPVVLAISGFDPSGGAGMAADLKTIAALGGHGAAALTCVTVQNTCEVREVHSLPASLLGAQIDALLDDMEVRAVKVGLLPTPETVGAVAERARRLPNLVLDPIQRAGTGVCLAEEAAVVALREQLIPVATLVTPNLDEATRLSGLAVRDPEDMEAAARALCRLGASAALVKGGHLPGAPVDVLLVGERVERLAGDRIRAPRVHGLGCTLSAAIACGLARGLALTDAVTTGRAHLRAVLAGALRVGNGSAVPGPGAPC